MFKGQCHCGNVQLSAPEAPPTLTACTCSICHRYGAQWAYFKVGEVDVSCFEQPTQTYRWGDEDIDFHHCPRCGCLTHYTSTKNKPDAEDRIAFNGRMFDPALTAAIRLRHFDGADTWTYLD